MERRSMNTTDKHTRSGTVETDVLVVGGGPAGLTASALLARQGVNAITISKRAGTAHTPRAHITNQRTMEVMRDLGIEEQVRRSAAPTEAMAETVWGTSVAGRELVRVRAWGNGPDRKGEYEASSPSAMCNIGQHELEPVILQAALGSGADIRFSTELVDIVQDHESARAVVHGPDADETYEIRARYVIAADGGRSTVAAQLGFEHDGETAARSAVNVWFEADLAQYRAHRPGALFHAVDTSRDVWLGAGALITVKPWNEYVAVMAYDPATEQIDMSEQAMLQRIERIIGDPAVRISIKAINEWQVNYLIAREYRKGRVFLAGDAAHRHSPANGLGSNTSVQDAYNLAWKLTLVVGGKAGDPLLDSYHAERQPVGRQVVERSRASTNLSGKIPPLLRAREAGADSLAELSSDTDAGRGRRESLTKALADIENYHYNAHGVELGQRYTSAALVTDGSPPPPSGEDPEVYYQPTTYPGAHLPHAWVLHNGRLVSTLDAAGQGQFVLITGIGGESWLRSAERMAEEMGIALIGRSIGVGLEYDDVYRDWCRLREVDERGCILVRPDRYIAWRSFDRVRDADGVLRSVLTRILARSGDDRGRQPVRPADAASADHVARAVA
jgi:2,4-dichlorophenol 6-monooxygenase